jgi:hypothetical protein
MFNVKEIKENKENITVGNGKSKMATKIGSMNYQVIQIDGSGININLHEVKIIPKLWVILFSINKFL